eukprot:gene18994-24811_t
MKEIAKQLPGIRVVRQDPWECLISFITSSCNNIKRITEKKPHIKTESKVKIKAAERHLDSKLDSKTADIKIDNTIVGQIDSNADSQIVHHLYTFPDITQLAGVTENQLRELGFVQDELMTLPGVGRKVADCVALFSLDRSDAIPVDTHVWEITIRDYAPHLSTGITNYLSTNLTSSIVI